MPTRGTSSTITRKFWQVLSLRRKEAIQKTIMSMTLGKDVSALFPDVLKNIATADLDQKKLVYLYLMSVLQARLPPPVLALCLLSYQELRKIASGPLYPCREHICTGFRRP